MNNDANNWTYELNDLVWAKMKGFPPWPGRVSEPTDALKKSVKKNAKCIFFYGTDNYAWIEITALKPYFQFKDSLSYANNRTPNFKEALKAIEQYIAVEGPNPSVTNNGTSENERRFDNLVNNITPIQPAKKKISNARVSTSSSSVKRGNKPQNGSKNKSKRVRRNSISSTSNIDVLTTVGLTNNHSPSPHRRNNSLLDRPRVQAPECSLLDVTKISKSLLSKNIRPSSKKFGFIGLGKIGSGIVKNLLNSGHKVMVWNRTPEKSQIFEEAGALIALTPSDVVSASDITFSCVSNPAVVKEIVFGNCGILQEISNGQGYVELSGIDAETSIDINEAVLERGGRYLEAMLQGSKHESEEGELVCMAAGDKTLFDDCQSAFCALSKNSFYLGEVGTATKMNLILHTIKAVALAGLAEGMAIAERASISKKDLLDILGMTKMKSELYSEKGQMMVDHNFHATNESLKHLQKDMHLSLSWVDTMDMPCPVSASANELFKHAKLLGYGDSDTSSIYLRAKF